MARQVGRQASMLFIRKYVRGVIVRGEEAVVAPPIVDGGHVVGAAHRHAARHRRARHHGAQQPGLALLSSWVGGVVGSVGGGLVGMDKSGPSGREGAPLPPPSRQTNCTAALRHADQRRSCGCRSIPHIRPRRSPRIHNNRWRLLSLTLTAGGTATRPRLNAAAARVNILAPCCCSVCFERDWGSTVCEPFGVWDDNDDWEERIWCACMHGGVGRSMMMQQTLAGKS